MSNEKKKTETVAAEAASMRPTSSAKSVEESLRLATLLKQEQIPDVEAQGFLAGAGLKPTDRMTVAAFRKRFSTWRNQPAGRETR